ncbi:hypothetical protein AGMMS49546_16440 [Spirochaetia bacterium]|nr:hypothetical protein AGMMS49546_16440 [Spirochaetia bacterium]
MKKKLTIVMEVLAVLLTFALILAGCDTGTGTGGGDPDITYTAAANGDAVTTTSTKIDFVFTAAVTGLTADDITIAGTPGTAAKGTLTGSGTNWSLALTGTTGGAAAVSINKAGIESGAKSITLYSGLTWTAATQTVFGSDFLGGIQGVSYGGGKFVAVGDSGKIAYSNRQE